MPSLDTPKKLALVATVLFILIGSSATYNLTEKLFGKIVKQSGPTYASGNGLHNRGFLLHAIVVGVLTYFIVKKLK